MNLEACHVSASCLALQKTRASYSIEASKLMSDRAMQTYNRRNIPRTMSVFLTNNGRFAILLVHIAEKVDYFLAYQCDKHVQPNGNHALTKNPGIARPKRSNQNRQSCNPEIDK